MRRTHAITLLWTLLLCAAPMFGCNRTSGPPRVAVTGAVTKGGTPMAKGVIMFRPAGAGAPAATADVREGRYRFDNRNGPVAGLYQVVIQTAFEGSRVKQDLMQKPPPAGGRPSVDAEASGLAPSPWTFDVEVPAETEYERNFELP